MCTVQYKLSGNIDQLTPIYLNIESKAGGNPREKKKGMRRLLLKVISRLLTFDKKDFKVSLYFTLQSKVF